MTYLMILGMLLVATGGYAADQEGIYIPYGPIAHTPCATLAAMDPANPMTDLPLLATVMLWQAGYVTAVNQFIAPGVDIIPGDLEARHRLLFTAVRGACLRLPDTTPLHTVLHLVIRSELTERTRTAAAQAHDAQDILAAQKRVAALRKRQAQQEAAEHARGRQPTTPQMWR